jgi:hypothetical protein
MRVSKVIVQGFLLKSAEHPFFVDKMDNHGPQCWSDYQTFQIAPSIVFLFQILSGTESMGLEGTILVTTLAQPTVIAQILPTFLLLIFQKSIDIPALLSHNY